MEVVVTVLPLLLSLTVLSEQPERACGPLAAGAVVAFVLSQRLKKVNRNDLKKLWDINILEVLNNIGGNYSTKLIYFL